MSKLVSEYELARIAALRSAQRKAEREARQASRQHAAPIASINSHIQANSAGRTYNCIIIIIFVLIAGAVYKTNPLQ